ncbi:MAG: TolB family protein, partial [Chloroflexota bacterium]
MPRALAPDDLYKLRVPTDPRISPDGRQALVTVQASAPKRDGYRHALWLLPLDPDGGAPRQLTLGQKNDSNARWSPDGRTIAFLSDRRHLVEEEPDAGDKKDREDGTQIHLLSLDGGEARRLTDLPRGVGGFEWSPDGSRLVALSTSHRADRKEDRKARGLDRKPDSGDPPDADYRYIDRLGYMFNGPGFIYDHVAHLWVIDVATGTAVRLTDGPASDDDPAWSPDGTKVAFTTRLNRDYDLAFRSDIVVVDVATGKRTRITNGSKPIFFV